MNTVNLNIPELTSEQCLAVLDPDMIIKVQEACIIEAELYENNKKKKEKIRMCKEMISDIQNLRKKIKKNINGLSDKQRKESDVSLKDVDFFVLQAFKWIDNSSTRSSIKITPRGKMRATAIYYSHPENKKQLAKYMTTKIKEDERDSKIDKKAKESRIKRKIKNRKIKKARY